MAIWSQNRYIVGGLVLVILGHWSVLTLARCAFSLQTGLALWQTDCTLHRNSGESSFNSWSRMSDNREPRQIFTCDLHLLDVLRLHRSFAEHIQAHWNNIFPLAQFDGSRAPHSYDFYWWPHFLYTCVRGHFTGVLRMKGSVAHLSNPVFCPISLRHYSWCWILMKLWVSYSLSLPP